MALHAHDGLVCCATMSCGSFAMGAFAGLLTAGVVLQQQEALLAPSADLLLVPLAQKANRRDAMLARADVPRTLLVRREVVARVAVFAELGAVLRALRPFDCCAKRATAGGGNAHLGGLFNVETGVATRADLGTVQAAAGAFGTVPIRASAAIRVATPLIIIQVETCEAR